MSHTCTRHSGTYPDNLTDADREKTQLRILSEEDVGDEKGSRAFCSLLYSKFEKQNKKETKQAQLADIAYSESKDALC